MRLIIPEKVKEILTRYDSAADPRTFIFPFLNGYEDANDRMIQKQIGRANTRANQHLRKLCNKGGISRNYSFHSSRHFFATQALRKGVRVEVLKEILTHSSLKQTLEYVRICENDLDTAMLLT